MRSLQVRYDSLVIGQQQLMTLLLELEAGLGDVSALKVPSRIVWLPMAFEDSATLGAVERYQETVRASARGCRTTLTSFSASMGWRAAKRCATPCLPPAI